MASRSPFAGGKTRAAFLGGVALGALALGGASAAAGDASPLTVAALALAGLAGTAGALHAAHADFPVAVELDPDALADVVAMRLDANGDVRLASDASRSVMGVAPELLLGSGFFDRLHVVDRVAFMRAMAELRGGAERLQLDLRLRLLGDGGSDSYRGYRLELRRAGAPGAPFAGSLRDNDELARLKGALDQARAHAAAAEAERGRLLAGLAHELRTPLTAILGFSDILAGGGMGGFTDRRQKEYVGLIRQSGQHLLTVLDSMAQVATLEAGSAVLEPERFRLAEAVETCRAMLSLAAEAKGVTVLADVSAACGTIFADRRTVQQILVILLSNAVKFTPGGGKVSVAARRLGSRLHLTVADTGCGIAPNDLQKLGRPFTQVGDTAARRQGTGLGLCLAKELVSRHGGTMSIESTPGEGTVVLVSLPAEWSQAAVQPEAERQIAHLNGERTSDGALRKAG